jgi:hypothetical protein
MTNKEIGIGEIGTVPTRFEDMQGNSSEHKVEWFEDAFTKIKYEYPLLKSVTWFLEKKKTTLKTTSSTGASTPTRREAFSVMESASSAVLSKSAVLLIACRHLLAFSGIAFTTGVEIRSIVRPW